MKDGKEKNRRIFQLAAKYLSAYMQELTNGKEEAFIAITDIHAEMLPDEYLLPVEGCLFVRAEQEDYADAVRYRNDSKIKKLVLLCSDSIRRIDSLKDFIEYPIIPEDMDLLWKLLIQAFEITERDGTLEEYVYTLVQNIPVEIGELLEYLEDCISREGKSIKFNRRKINDHVNRFGIWRTKGDGLNKGRLKRQIRYSKPDIVRQRLEKALEDKNMPDKLRKQIVSALGKDRLEKFIKEAEFEWVEGYFRYKKTVKKQKEESEQEEHVYSYSYDMCLKEEGWDVAAVEEEIKAGSGEVTEETDGRGSSFAKAGELFAVEKHELATCRKEIEDLLEILEEYGILREKKERWKSCLTELLSAFDQAVAREDFQKITPVMLSRYCKNQERFLSAYFVVLGWLLTDEAMNHLCENTDIVETFQTLFCREEKGRIVMPFYHPVAGLYFLRLKKLYETAYQEMENLETISDIPSFIVEQEKLWFPVRFLQKGRKLYQLDYTSVRKPGELLFYEKESRGANSPVNFRLLNSVIEEYIIQNPYLGMLSVSIVDLDDFQGLPFLLRRLRKLVNGKTCLLSRITIQIISKRERELKRELERLYHMGMGDPGIYFRFIKGKYVDGGNELEIRDLLENCDLLFFADTDAIYNSGKMIRYTQEPNAVRKKLGNFDLKEQMEILQSGKNHIELLWDTLQRIQNGGGAVLSKWNNQELDMRKLREISAKVQKDAHFEAVIVSANECLLRHIYREENYQIRKSRISGNESILLMLSQKNKKNELKEKGTQAAEISLSGILDELTGEEDFCRQLLEAEGLQDIFLQAVYEDGKLIFLFIVETKEKEAAEEEREKYQQFAGELVKEVFCGNGYMTAKFREMLIDEFYGKTENYSLALALYQASQGRGNSPEAKVRIQEPGEVWHSCYYPTTDIMELLDMLGFFEQLIEVDESSVTRFMEYYKKDMLLHVLHTSETEGFLETSMKRNMRNLYERIKN